jgi:pimeloyl-ACP methyl ester carboxylesterase
VTRELVTAAPLAHLRWHATGHARGWAVLLHGVGGGREAWNGVAPTLARIGWNVAAVDLPGYGLSPACNPFDLAGMAARVLSLLDHLDAPRALLVGHSMGGMLAQEIHALAPGRVAGLVLANTSPAFGRPEGDWQQAFLRQRFAPLDAGLGMSGLAAQLVPALLGPQAGPQAVQAAQDLMAGVPDATYRAALTALVAFDRRAALPAIAVPTLVITGEHDQAAPPAVSQRMAQKIPRAALSILPGAGHLAPIEQPAAFARALDVFLTTMAPRQTQTSP